MALTNVHELLEFKLQTMLAAEKRNLEMLEDAAADTKEPRLRELLASHTKETQGQIERLEGVFRAFNKRPRNVDPSVMEGLVEERRRFMNEDPTPNVLDVFTVGACIKTEHAEIAAYEAILLLGQQAGITDLVEPLRQSLNEEMASLDRLRGLAQEMRVEPAQTRGGEQVAQ